MSEFDLVRRSSRLAVREPLLSSIVGLCMCSEFFWLADFACKHLPHNGFRRIISM